MGCGSPPSLLCLSLLPSEDGAGTNDVWPLLRVVKLSHLKAEDYEDLYEVLSYRKTHGRAVKTVKIDPRSLSLCPLENAELLKQCVEIRRGPSAFYFPDFQFDFSFP